MIVSRRHPRSTGVGPSRLRSLAVMRGGEAYEGMKTLSEGATLGRLDPGGVGMGEL